LALSRDTRKGTRKGKGTRNDTHKGKGKRKRR
jgi:hypothetical protein